MLGGSQQLKAYGGKNAVTRASVGLWRPNGHQALDMGDSQNKGPRDPRDYKRIMGFLIGESTGIVLLYSHIQERSQEQ